MLEEFEHRWLVKKKFKRDYLFARHLGISRSCVSRVLSGEDDVIGAQLKRRWADALGVTVTDIWPDAVSVEEPV